MVATPWMHTLVIYRKPGNGHSLPSRADTRGEYRQETATHSLTDGIRTSRYVPVSVELRIPSFGHDATLQESTIRIVESRLCITSFVAPSTRALSRVPNRATSLIHARTVATSTTLMSTLCVLMASMDRTCTHAHPAVPSTQRTTDADSRPTRPDHHQTR